MEMFNHQGLVCGSAYFQAVFLFYLARIPKSSEKHQTCECRLAWGGSWLRTKAHRRCWIWFKTNTVSMQPWLAAPQVQGQCVYSGPASTTYIQETSMHLQSPVYILYIYIYICIWIRCSSKYEIRNTLLPCMWEPVYAYTFMSQHASISKSSWQGSCPWSGHEAYSYPQRLEGFGWKDAETTDDSLRAREMGKWCGHAENTLVK